MLTQNCVHMRNFAIGAISRDKGYVRVRHNPKTRMFGIAPTQTLRSMTLGWKMACVCSHDVIVLVAAYASCEFNLQMLRIPGPAK